MPATSCVDGWLTEAAFRRLHCALQRAPPVLDVRSGCGWYLSCYRQCTQAERTPAAASTCKPCTIPGAGRVWLQLITAHNRHTLCTPAHAHLLRKIPDCLFSSSMSGNPPKCSAPGGWVHAAPAPEGSMLHPKVALDLQPAAASSAAKQDSVHHVPASWGRRRRTNKGSVPVSQIYTMCQSVTHSLAYGWLWGPVPSWYVLSLMC